MAISEAEAERASTHRRALRALELWVVSGAVLAEAALSTLSTAGADPVVEDAVGAESLKALIDAVDAVGRTLKKL